MIEVDRLVKRYGRITAVEGLSFGVERGSVLALLGPNGAGKSTTIRAVTGQLRPTSGRVAVCGHDLGAEPLAAKRAFGYVPDRPYLYPNLSGRELLRFLGRLREVPDAERKANDLLARFELSEAADELVDTYSHGMRQRLTFCAALLHAPMVLIIDEPMVGLDPRGARDVRQLLRRHADDGGAVLLTTHSMDVAEAVADDIVLLARGRAVARGSMSQLRSAVGDEAANLEAIFIQLTSEAERVGQ
ncbi:MAG TPA: ABC transporter ATP-binding protein [Trueperaceae bacterium]|nr:ABC transporter ATP-binding protein [Trueperaceae bacterium]